MPSLDPPATSLAAHKDPIAEPKREALRRRIMNEAAKRPGTSMHIADRLGEPYYSVERRCSDLKREGYLRFSARVRNPKGNWAYELAVTPGGLRWLHGGVEPSPPPTIRDLEVRVLAAAKRVAGDVGSKDCQERLVRAVEALEAHKEREARPTYDEPPREPYGTHRRRELAKMGVWVRQSGATVPLMDMNDFHLEGALRWCYRHGASECDVEVEALQGELKRRRAVIGAQPKPY